MGQVSSTLRRGEGCYFHGCPACEEMHPLPDSWPFDGNLEKPTFSPSFKQSGVRRIFDASGNWTGEWMRDANGNTLPFICHYVLRAGVLHFCGDCTHALAGQAVPLPKLPEGLTDH